MNFELQNHVFLAILFPFLIPGSDLRYSLTVESLQGHNQGVEAPS